MAAVETHTPPPPIPGERNQSLGDYARNYGRRLRGGDLGALPAISGLVVLCAVFGAADDVFLTARNFANLLTQGAAVTVIAMGLVFVLLLGEIDLSAGFASGVCATIMSVLLVDHGWPWYLAVLAALVTGVVIGLTLGTLVAKVRIPSFVVTLAAFLAFQGVQLLFLGGGKNITIPDNPDGKIINAIENKNLPIWLGWALLIVGVLAYVLSQLLKRSGRIRRGLSTEPILLIVVRTAALLVIGGLAVYALSQERSNNPPHLTPSGRVLGVSLKGVPIVVVIILVLFLTWTFVLGRTSYGRHMYAVGGNIEAARRAGITVDRIKISAFVVCSSMAAIGGIVAVSRLRSVDPNTGGSNVLLYAVGAAVIGGTSLFGGKGRVLDALLGGAVIAVIDNGMGLLGYSSGVKYIITGIVLLAAAGVDALTRRRAAASGLR
jgi:D-xylose transport system permease protein